LQLEQEVSFFCHRYGVQEFPDSIAILSLLPPHITHLDMDVCQIVFFQIMPYNGFLCLLKETVGKGVIMFRLGYYSLIAQNVILVYKSFGPWV